jgi:SAM-dependent methyltransferase
MKIKNSHERLFSLWGAIDEQHNELIASKVTGKRVLDVGCGYGSLVNYLDKQGFDVEGWDHDPESIKVAHELFPESPIKLADAEREEHVGSFDTVILKDSLHHLAGEGDVQASFQNIRRLLNDRGRLVILDPNPMWILRTARKLASHVDPEASCDFAVRLLQEQGFEVRGIQYHEILGLPLSGGYVGLRLVPNWQPLNQLVATANASLSRFVNRLGLGSQLCWRYLIHADVRPRA